MSRPFHLNLDCLVVGFSKKFGYPSKILEQVSTVKCDYLGTNLSHVIPFKLCTDISENLQHTRTKISHSLMTTRFLFLWIAWYMSFGYRHNSSVEIWCSKLLVTLYIFLSAAWSRPADSSITLTSRHLHFQL